MMLIFQAAMAAEPSTYALSTPVALPPAGPVRVGLGADLIGGAPETLGGGLLLTDASGVAVPYAVLSSSNGSGTSAEDLSFVPTGSGTWETDATDAPVDALVLDVYNLSDLGAVYATVSWEGAGGRVSAPRTLLYQLDQQDGRTLELPHVKGPFRVELAPVDSGTPRLGEISAVRNAPDHVPPIVEEVPVEAPVLTEDGRARYVLRLRGMRAVRALRFELPATSDVFEREVFVRVPGSPEYAGTNGMIKRIRVGSATVDQVQIPIADTVGDTLVVEVALNRGEPLPIDAVDVISEGVYLIARDAGAGPHTLYAGATEASSAYDLSIAIPDLLRTPTPFVEVESAAANPSFVPLPTREGVDAPGPDLSLARFAFERDVIATPGWARILLDRDILARTRPDVADVRLVDAAGRQIPFFLWNTGDEDAWDAAPLVRKEEGRVTEIRVPLDGTAPVGSVQIQTSASTFARSVTILRDTGRATVALRHVTWDGVSRGSTLVVALNERIGDTLLLRIDNGDNAPLPVEAVRVTYPRWELRARIPEGGARLVYGSPGATEPAYDLYLLRQEILQMPVGDATVGPERPLAAPATSAVDQGMTLVGVGLLAVGLLGMVVRVLRGMPPAEPPDLAAG
jgi:hypothetical protein